MAVGWHQLEDGEFSGVGGGSMTWWSFQRSKHEMEVISGQIWRATQRGPLHMLRGRATGKSGSRCPASRVAASSLPESASRPPSEFWMSDDKLFEN
jgi:hypothetical protein